MIALSPLQHTILSMRKIVEVIFQFSISELAKFYLLSRTVRKDYLLEFPANGTKVDFLFLYNENCTNY
jgi:hypothetical protein